MEGGNGMDTNVSFSSFGLKSALETQSNAISQLMAGAANVQAMASGQNNDNTFRTEVMKQGGIGQKVNAVV